MAQNNSSDVRLALTKIRMAELFGTSSLQDILIEAVVKNIGYFVSLERVIKLNILPAKLRQKLLNALAQHAYNSNLLLLRSRKYTNDDAFQEYFKGCEALLNPFTSEFALDWLIYPCLKKSKWNNVEEVFKVLAANAPELTKLTFGKHFLDDDNLKSTTLNSGMISCIGKMTNLSQLTLHKKCLITPEDLLEISENLPKLVYLDCASLIISDEKDLPLAEVMANWPQLKVFLFDVCQHPVGVFSNKEVRGNIAEKCLEFPQLQVIGDYANNTKFYFMAESVESIPSSKLQHLSINVFRPSVTRFHEQLKNVTHLSVRGKDETMAALGQFHFDNFVLPESIFLFPRVESLCLSDSLDNTCNTRILLHYGQNLKELTLQCESQMMMGMGNDLRRLQSILELCPKLSQLNIQGNVLFEEAPIDHRVLANLRKFSWRFYGMPFPAPISKILIAPNLEEFDLQGVILTSEDLTILADRVKRQQALSNLTSFKLILSTLGLNKEVFDASCELVKNICAYSPNLESMAFDMSKYFYKPGGNVNGFAFGDQPPTFPNFFESNEGIKKFLAAMRCV